LYAQVVVTAYKTRGIFFALDLLHPSFAWPPSAWPPSTLFFFHLALPGVVFPGEGAAGP